MNLSIIIKCSRDQRIWRCLKSIDEKAEIIVSITPCKKIEKELKKRKIKYAITHRGNMALTANAGIKLATNKKLIIMDSDSYFEKGTIKKIYKTLNKYPIAKPRIEYHHNDTYISRLIAKERNYINNFFLVAYIPGLGIDRGVLEKIGGYIFNNQVRWTEDAELTYRLKKANIHIRPIKGAVIHHDPISLKHELKSAFFSGVGKRLSVEHANRFPDEDFFNIMVNFFRLEQIKNISERVRCGGIPLAFFMAIWSFFYQLGYYHQKITVYYTPQKNNLKILRTSG